MIRARCVFLCLLLGLGLKQAFGQSFYNRGSTVTVMPGTIFTVQDSLVNEGLLTNNGNLVMGGTWLNIGTYQPGAGEITFNSNTASEPQIINHSNQSFSKLTISGGGTKLILADITIEDELVLTDGVIEAQNNARVIIGDGVVVSGGSDAAHINAPVYQSAGGDRLYPLGNGHEYLPVYLSTEGNGNSLVGVEGFELAGQRLSGTSLSALSDQRYWFVDFGENPSGATIALPLRHEDLLGAVNDVVVAAADEIEGEFVSLGRGKVTGTLSDGVVWNEHLLTQPFVTVGAQVNDGAVLVYNAISQNANYNNTFLRIANIEQYPKNRLSIFNRWGDKVFELTDYDNQDRVFRGYANVNSHQQLSSGTYFYTLEGSGGLKTNGFIVIRN
jgi:hypothetical protein